MKDGGVRGATLWQRPGVGRGGLQSTGCPSPVRSYAVMRSGELLICPLRGQPCFNPEGLKGAGWVEKQVNIRSAALGRAEECGVLCCAEGLTEQRPYFLEPLLWF